MCSWDTWEQMIDQVQLFSEIGRFEQLGEALSLESMQKEATPPSTQQKARWAYNVFLKWSEWKTLQKANVTLLSEMGDEEIDQTLALFVREVRKEDGSRYPGRSLNEIVLSLQKYLELNGKIVRLLDPKMSLLRAALNLEMQKSTKAGIGMITKQAEPISKEDEEKLWEAGILSGDDPQGLLRAVFWLIGINFGIRGGEEQRNLTSENFIFKTDENKKRVLVYQETVSKTYKGGLKSKKSAPRQALVYEAENPSRCLIHLLPKYLSLTPPGSTENALYLRPLTNVGSKKVWYSKQCVGHNSLKKVVSTIMCEAGFKGNFTNHSLRATTATRLFHSEIDEQLIAEQTGHRSLEALRRYKRTNSTLKQNVSKMLHCDGNEKSTENEVICPESAENDFHPLKKIKMGRESERPQIVLNVYGGIVNLGTDYNG